ncbi:hypothetical protein ACFTXJ_26490 [Streptomyces zhihengii]|uniref:hypothetical protein n=1 Tax=Streptomyces zhihengii TaxID=1818004 RepID=UPI00362EA3C9
MHCTTKRRPYGPARLHIGAEIPALARCASWQLSRAHHIAHGLLKAGVVQGVELRQPIPQVLRPYRSQRALYCPW